MSTDRRTFLKMLGIGAGTLLVPKIVLGSSDAGVIASPGKGVAKHWVGYPSRELGCNFSVLALTAEEVVVRPVFERDTDPHEAFFKASLEIQKALGEETLRRLWEVPEVMRRNVEVITNVLMPIHARSIDGPGFEVVADCSIEVIGWGVRDRKDRQEQMSYGETWSPPKGYEVYSMTGEYPVELPTQLDLNHLMSTAEEWNKLDQDLMRRIAHINVRRL